MILCVDQNFGLGKDNKLVWKCSEELKLFKSKTLKKTIVVGRKTFDSLPKLYDRDIIVLTKNKNYKLNELDEEKIHIINDVYKINYVKKYEDVWVCGGNCVYETFLKNNLIKNIHISILKKVYDCDTYFDKKLLEKFIIKEYKKYDEFDHYILEINNDNLLSEFNYLKLLNNVMTNGVERIGRNGITRSLFCENLKFDLRNGFPLLTTKKMFFRGIVEELLFFIRGDTNTKYLEEKKINIWKGNTNKEFLKMKNLPYSEGVMGPMYGWQWRKFNQEYKLDKDGYPELFNKDEKSIDQLKNVIDLIKKDPNSRRILMTTYNPIQSEEGVLYPCHSIVLQFYVEDGYIDMFCFNRSSDTFLGLPFNIASSSLLLIIIAKCCNLIPRYFNLTLGDCHVYKEHYDCVYEQINRIPWKFPNLNINKKIETIEDIDNLNYYDFELIEYNSHPSIITKMMS